MIGELIRACAKVRQVKVMFGELKLSGLLPIPIAIRNQNVLSSSFVSRKHSWASKRKELVSQCEVKAVK